MKKLTLVTVLHFLFLSTSAFAHNEHPTISELKKAPVVFAGIQAAHIFESDFEQTSGKKITKEFVGFHAQSASGEVEVGVYNVLSANETAKDLYGCHFHQDSSGAVKDVHCRSEGQQEKLNYSASGRNFSVEEFEVSATQAVDLFEKKIANPNLIEKAKFWRAGDNIQISFKWTPVNQSEQSAYYMCHYHGAHMDCHRQSRPGPNEPQN